MAKKLTIMIDDAVYEGLHRVVGRGSISKFIEDLARPHVAQRDLSAQYREAARDAARHDRGTRGHGEIALRLLAHGHSASR